MQDDFNTQLRKAISHERLEAYRLRGTDGTDLNLYAHYAWNISLCESLYPALQGLEVALRNSVHDAATENYGTETWYDDPRIIHSFREQEEIKSAKETLLRERKPVEAGRVIAELRLGFWTSLLDVRYEQVLWPKLLKAAFPGMRRRIRTRKELSRRLNRIRNLRNRVFHHEPIWYWTDLSQQHSELMETIGWVNPAMQQMIKIMNRFEMVYQQNAQPYQATLAALMSAKTT